LFRKRLVCHLGVSLVTRTLESIGAQGGYQFWRW
jgi:hypothetical protein